MFLKTIYGKNVAVPHPVRCQVPGYGCITLYWDEWWLFIPANGEVVNVMSDEKFSKQPGFYHEDEPLT